MAVEELERLKKLYELASDLYASTLMADLKTLYQVPEYQRKG